MRFTEVLTPISRHYLMTVPLFSILPETYSSNCLFFIRPCLLSGQTFGKIQQVFHNAFSLKFALLYSLDFYFSLIFKRAI